MEVSLKVAVAAIIILIVAVLIIALTGKFGGDASGQMQGIFDWMGNLLGGAPQ